MIIQRLSEYKGNGTSLFDCGQEDLNLFLSKYASQNDRKGIGRTYLWINGQEILGFFTLSAAEICCDELPRPLRKGLPRYPIPAIRIARFGIAKSVQKKGYGGKLLREALIRAAIISRSVGANLVVVDAKPSAAGFYEHYGFVQIIGEESTLVLPLKTIIYASLGELSY